MLIVIIGYNIQRRFRQQTHDNSTNTDDSQSHRSIHTSTDVCLNNLKIYKLPGLACCQLDSCRDTLPGADTIAAIDNTGESHNDPQATSSSNSLVNTSSLTRIPIRAGSSLHHDNFSCLTRPRAGSFELETNTTQRLASNIGDRNADNDNHKIAHGDMTTSVYGPTINIMSTTQHAARQAPNAVWIPLKTIGYVPRVFTSVLLVGIDTDPKTTTGICRPFKSAAGFKDNRAMFTDEAMTIHAFDGFFKQGTMHQVIYCRRDRNETFGIPAPDSTLVIPAAIGGPPTLLNTRPTFANAEKFEYTNPPYYFNSGMCKGTNLTSTPKCQNRGKPQRSTDDEGKTIPMWCCKSCDPQFSYHIIDGDGDCWFPQEIQVLPKRISKVEEEDISIEDIVVETEEGEKAPDSGI